MKKYSTLLITLFLLPAFSFAATFGYSLLGATTDITDKFSNANAWAATSDCDPVTFYYGGFTQTSGTVNVSGAIYDFGDGNISGNNRLDVVTGVIALATNNTTGAFFSGAITGTDLVNGTTYYIESFSSTTGTRTKYTNPGLTDEFTSQNGINTPPATHATRGGAQTNTQISAYVDCAAPAVTGGQHKFIFNGDSSIFQANHKFILQ